MAEEIVYNFRNSAELYEAALDLHDKENMQQKVNYEQNYKQSRKTT